MPIVGKVFSYVVLFTSHITEHTRTTPITKWCTSYKRPAGSSTGGMKQPLCRNKETDSMKASETLLNNTVVNMFDKHCSFLLYTVEYNLNNHLVEAVYEIWTNIISYVIRERTF